MTVEKNMAYKTLYRVFRPTVFDDVYGQEHITDILKKQVENKTVSHAYLFCGSRGTGKTSTAKIFANAVNCLAPKDGNPCKECDVCLEVENDAMVDIVEIDAASNNGVDNIRDIREKVALLPAISKYKVYIVDEVHMLSSGAFNALLKTLEEPPPHVIFILATTELRKVPATILSRCQKYEFKRISNKDIVARLKYITECENINCEQEALELIAQQAEGSMRDALSIAEQCITGADNLTKESVAQAIGVANAEQIALLTQAIIGEDPAQAVKIATSLQKDGVGAHNVLNDIICSLSEELAKNAHKAYECSNILRSLEALISMQQTLRYSPAPNAVLMTAIVRACVNTVDIDTKDIELRVKKLEDRVEKLALQGVSQAPATSNTQSAGTQVSRESIPKIQEQQTMQEVQPMQKQTVQKAEVKPTLPVDKMQTKEKQSDEVLKKFCKALEEKNLMFLPAAKVIKSIAKHGTSLYVYVNEDDMPIAQTIDAEGSRVDVAAVTQQVFGAALSVQIKIKEKNKPQQTDMCDVLNEMFGEDNVAIINKK